MKNILPKDLSLRDMRSLFLNILHKRDSIIYAPIKTNGKWKEQNASTIEGVLTQTDSVFSDNDCYVTVNPFQNTSGRRKDFVQAINGIYIDLDLHDETATPDSLNALCAKIQQFFDCGELLYPTMLTLSGRGLALFYLYEVSIPQSDTKWVQQHDTLYMALIYRMQRLLGEDIKVDTCVRDASRVCRIPGTKNQKAGRFSEILAIYSENDTPVRYTLNEIQSGNHLTEYCSTPPEAAPRQKKATGEKAVKPKPPKKQPSQKRLIQQVKDYMNMDPATLRAVSFSRLNRLKQWLELRAYNISGVRELFLFIYYCTLKPYLYAEEIITGCCFEDDAPQFPCYDSEEAAAELCRINARLSEPLKDAEVFQSVIQPVEQHPLGLYRFTDESIISLLGMDEEEASDLGFACPSVVGITRAEREVRNMMACQKIASLYEAGCSPNEIQETIPEYSVHSIKKVLANHYRPQKARLLQDIMELYQQGEPTEKIAQSLHCSTQKVRRTIQKSKSQSSYILKKNEKKKEYQFPTGEVEAIYTHHRDQCTLQEDTAQRERALRLMHGGSSLLILGSAGTGKSQIVKDFLTSLPKAELTKTLIVAPTGKAALNIGMGAVTIHKAFGLGLYVQAPKEVTSVPLKVLQCHRVIIDEVSMCRIDVMDTILRIIHQAEEITHQTYQLIFLGDFKQCGPVATTHDKEQIRLLYPYADGVLPSESAEWKALHLEKVILTHIYRQHSDYELAEILDRIGYGDSSAIQWLNENLPHICDPNAIFICPTNRYVSAINQFYARQFAGKPFKTYSAEYRGRVSGQELPVPIDLTLSVGMRVMTICNGSNFVNGSTGVITKLNAKSIYIDFQDGRPPVIVTPMDFALDNGILYKQLPVVLAYAITTHKSQGLTFSSINLIPGFFDAGQLYIALSRCTTRNGIHLMKPLKPSDLIVYQAALAITI